MMTPQSDVTLFVQCLVDGLYPDVGMAMVKLFRKLDLSMDCPETQTCCGQMAFNTGYTDQARAAAKHFIEIFEPSKTIVCPSGSCVDMVRHHYPGLFQDDPAWRSRAESVARKTFELSEYLIDVLKLENLPIGYTGKVTYHDSCHLLRGLGVAEQPRKLISMARQAELVEMENSDKCCGFGGTFAIKYADISTAILEEKVDNIIATGADAVVGCDISCLMQIQGMLSRRSSPVKAIHLARFLAD